MKQPNYTIESDTPDYLLIRDIGPWDQHPTVTNAAEQVVEDLAIRLSGRKLYYIDSEGETDRILVENGQFAGFAFEQPEIV